MKTVTPEMKLRSLISHGAQVWQEGAWRPLSQVKLSARRTPTNMLNAARAAGIVVKCACGCGAMCSYGEIEFDHAIARVNGGATTIGWLQPLRRDPCHRAKSRIDLKVRDKIRRIRQKFFGDRSPRRGWRWPSQVIPSRPLSGRPFQLYAIQGGRA